jgi:hypothetical protein
MSRTSKVRAMPSLAPGGPVSGSTQRPVETHLVAVPVGQRDPSRRRCIGVGLQSPEQLGTQDDLGFTRDGAAG